MDEVSYWDEQDNPITRLRHFMINVGWWDENSEKEWMLDARKRVRQFIVLRETFCPETCVYSRAPGKMKIGKLLHI